jgi:hypothetical protein
LPASDTKYRALIRLLFLVFLFVSNTLVAQKIYRGIIVDSATLANLRDVHISLKNRGRGTTTNSSGSFLISAKATDTLVFSAIGYHSLELPLLFEEDALFILLRENTLLLNEITISAKRLYPNKIEDRSKVAPKKLDPMAAFISPFDYFWKLEREKRKLFRVVEENNRTQTFRQVITDPDVKEILMKDYEVTENTYYQLIAEFNQQHAAVHYFTDPDAIMEALHTFFEGAGTRK